MDISLPFKLKRRKLATSKQKKIITLFNNLFSSGFHLVEIISFLDRSLLLEKEYVSQMRLGLSKGKSFSEMMGNLGFSSAIVTQLSLAEVHGNHVFHVLGLVGAFDQSGETGADFHLAAG